MKHFVTCIYTSGRFTRLTLINFDDCMNETFQFDSIFTFDGHYASAREQLMGLFINSRGLLVGFRIFAAAFYK